MRSQRGLLAHRPTDTASGGPTLNIKLFRRVVENYDERVRQVLTSSTISRHREQPIRAVFSMADVLGTRKAVLRVELKTIFRRARAGVDRKKSAPRCHLVADFDRKASSIERSSVNVETRKQMRSQPKYCQNSKGYATVTSDKKNRAEWFGFICYYLGPNLARILGSTNFQKRNPNPPSRIIDPGTV